LTFNIFLLQCYIDKTGTIMYNEGNMVDIRVDLR